MEVKMELNNEVYDKIVKLCENADQLAEEDKLDQAINKYKNALNLIPLPKEEWEASTWIYTAIGDMYFIKEDFLMAKEAFYNAMNCPDGITNPLILFRLGQCLFECEQFEKSKEYLLKAYMLEGDSIFYEEDEKYFDLIKEMI